MSAGPHILGGQASAALAGEEQQNHQNGDATRRRASMTTTYPSPSILLPGNKQQRRASTGTAPAQHAGHQSHERRVSFSGTYRVREYQIGEAERNMKLQAQRDSNQTRKERKQMRQEQLWRELAGEEGMWMMGIDFGPDLGADASYAAMSADDIGRLSDQIARASLPAWTRSAAAGEDHVDPAAVVDDPLSAERVVSSLFTSLLDTTASPSSSGGGAGSNGGKPKHMRRSSHDGISSSAAASTSNINTNTLSPSPRAVNQRRRSLELWSAASPRRASATATASAANHKPMEGLAQLRLMSSASRRLSASAAAPTTGVAEPPPPSFTVPLNDADVSKGVRRRSITTSRRHSLENKEMYVVINGKRIQRRSSLAARRRTSLEMEDEPNAADALDDVLMGRQPSSAQTSRRSEQQLVWMDPETRRNVVRADAEGARAARRRHSIALAPCYGGFHVETTFTNDTGALGPRMTRSFDGSILPSAISAKKEMLSERGRSNGINSRKSEEDAGSVGTPDTDPSSNELTLDGTRPPDGDDNSAYPTASSSCIAVEASVAIRRGSQTKFEDTTSAPHVPPLNITCIRQRRRPSSVAPTAKPDPRQRRSSDSDIGRPLARCTSAGRTADSSFARKPSRESATDTNAAAGWRMSGRNLPRRLSSQGPQQQDKRASHGRGTRNQQQQQQHQKQLAFVLSGVNSQSRRQNSIDALKNPFTWHHQEKHEDKTPFARIA